MSASCYYNDALAGNSDSYALEKRYLRKDGSVVWVALSVAVVRDARRHPKYFISVLADIDERKLAQQALSETEERLRHVQKLESLGVLAGGIAHDFNNLLVGILGNAGLMLAELSESSPLHDRVRTIEQAARRAAELTHHRRRDGRRDAGPHLRSVLHDEVHRPRARPRVRVASVLQALRSRSRAAPAGEPTDRG